MKFKRMQTVRGKSVYALYSKELKKTSDFPFNLFFILLIIFPVSSFEG